MTAPALTKMTKIEVVVPGGEAPAVRDLIQSVGATGYTSVSGVSGLGHHATARVGCSSINKRRWNYSSPLSRNRK